MIDFLLLCLLVAFFASCSAALTYFIDFCIGSPHAGPVAKGRIFGAYGNLILRKYYEREEKIKLQEEKYIKLAQDEIGFTYQPTDKDKARIRRKHLAKVRRVNYWKAAGVCHVCFNVWVSILSYPLVCLRLDLEAWDIALFFIPYAVLSNLIVRKLF